VIDLRFDAEHHDRLLERRLDILVPRLLAEARIDCWILIGREYAEDPVLTTMLPATWLSARRRTILVLTPTDRFAISRYAVGDLFRAEWDPQVQPDQWTRLREVLVAIDPATIGIGTSTVQAHADGLTVTQHEELVAALGPDLTGRLVAAGTLGIRWLETRLPEERAVLAEATEEGHRILRRGLSRDAIIPGVTTTSDLVWWYRQTVHDEGLTSWFHPSVSIQRQGGEPDEVIRKGDLIHVDFGIVMRGMCTDQQEHAYVLMDDQDRPPSGLEAGLQRANQIQAVLMDEFRTGRTGNDILAAARAQCQSLGLDATIYTHSIGTHGHGAGMTIGLWDQQDGVPGAGEHPLHPNTAYSIELMGVSEVPEWQGQQVRFMLEQDAWFDGSSCVWLDGHQSELITI